MNDSEDLPILESAQQQTPAMDITEAVVQARPLLEQLQNRQEGLIAEGRLPDDHPTLPGAVVIIKPFYRSLTDRREAGTWGVTVNDLDARIAGPFEHNGQVQVTVKPSGSPRRDATQAESHTVADAVTAMYQAWLDSAQTPEGRASHQTAHRRLHVAEQMARLFHRAA